MIADTMIQSKYFVNIPAQTIHTQLLFTPVSADWYMTFITL